MAFNIPFLTNRSTATELPDIYSFGMVEGTFVEIDLQNIYTRIIMDVIERTENIPAEVQPLLSDNCLGSDVQDGLVTLLACAMVKKSDLYIVYDASTKVIKRANSQQQSDIKADYDKMAKSKVGIYITFKNYKRTDMLKIYSVLEYCAIFALSKSMNLSKALQLKLSDLRSTTGAVDVEDVKVQAIAIAKALGAGKDVMLDANDVLETLKPDLTATTAAMEFIAQKQSFYLGLPASWITGIAPKGLGDTGAGNAKDVERGLKAYYFSIVKPVLETIFTIKTTFKSEDFEQLSSSLEALKTFDLTSAEYISDDNKRRIVNKLFGFPADEKAGPKEVPPALPPPTDKTVPPVVPPAVPPPKA